MAFMIERGGTVDDALRGAGAWLPYADQLVLSAAAEAGRLPPTLRNLAARHEQVAIAQRRVFFASLYPLAIIHLGLLLLPLTRMIDWEKGFQWSLPRYAGAVASGLIPLWAILILIGVLLRRNSPWLRTGARFLPIIGGYLRSQALADFSFQLANFLAAGVPIDRAWAVTGLISPSPDLKKAAEAMEGVIARGQAPGPRLADWACFPPDFGALYRSGETTGQLEINLERLGRTYQDAAQRSLGLAAIVYPGLLMFLVAVGVAAAVVKMYSDYLQMLLKLAE